MSKTTIRVTFAIITAVYVLTHFLGHARAEMPDAPVAVVHHVAAD